MQSTVPRSAPAILLAAAFALLASPAMANHLDERDVSAVHLVALVYHPYPDAKGDPFGVPYTEGNRTGDWMSLRYDAYWFPTAAFDGVTILERAPQGEGGGPFLETYANYRRAYEDRARTDAPVTIRMDGRIEAHALEVNVTVTPKLDLVESGLVIRAVLFEDDVAYEGGNGVSNHRFTIRTAPQTKPLNLSGTLGVPLAFSFEREDAWSLDRLGIAAWVQIEDDVSPRFQDREVLQAAAWTTEQTGPTIQVNKAVLLELYSASWCEACPPGDQAVDELSNELGLSSVRLRSEGWEYLRPGAPWTLPAALGIGLLVVAGLRARPPTPPSPPEVRP